MLGKPSEYGERYRGESYHIEGVELLVLLRLYACERLGSDAVEVIDCACNSCENGQRYNSSDHALALEEAEESVDTYGYRQKCPYVEANACPAGGFGRRATLGELGECGAVLVEYHPEEDNYSEDKKEGDNALFGLC